jgi:hypothetical protein
MALEMRGCQLRCRDGRCCLGPVGGRAPVLCAQHIFDLMTGADVEVETRPGDRAGTAELWLVPTVSEASGTLAAPTSEGEHDAEVKG